MPSEQRIFKRCLGFSLYLKTCISSLCCYNMCLGLSTLRPQYSQSIQISPGFPLLANLSVFAGSVASLLRKTYLSRIRRC
ncbi:hypothetical protein R3P38DRAFT_325080 [Favolaschia claudopus]|uniref:Uncharacterized protein n=1 Tax=Favolaschia claudopus TaxID=2862362 RepID=A0AAW0CV26_9AGAR